nr:hypothetical protein [uncultured Ottowia sp.]
MPITQKTKMPAWARTRSMPKKANKDDIAKQACGKWLGVRCFVQVFAFGGEDDGTKKAPTPWA